MGCIVLSKEGDVEWRLYGLLSYAIRLSCRVEEVRNKGLGIGGQARVYRDEVRRDEHTRSRDELVHMASLQQLGKA